MTMLPQGMALTPLNPAFRDQPHALLDRLREAAPVHADSEFERLYRHALRRHPRRAERPQPCRRPARGAARAASCAG